MKTRRRTYAARVSLVRAPNYRGPDTTVHGRAIHRFGAELQHAPDHDEDERIGVFCCSCWQATAPGAAVVVASAPALSNEINTLG